MYTFVVPKAIHELIRNLHPNLKRKVRSSLDMILKDPNSSKPLMDELSGLRSFRVSSFRIIYRIADPEKIELIAIGPRGRIYAETFRVLQKEKTEKRRRKVHIAEGPSPI